jgi:hypothetical protein
MTAGPNITSASGLRRIQAFALSTTGVPDGDQSGAAGYDGVNVEGARSFALTVPGITRVQHIGNDRLLAQDFLPATEGASGTTPPNKSRSDADRYLIETIGKGWVGGLLTNKRAAKSMCVCCLPAGPDTTEGAAVRRCGPICSQSRMVPRAGSAEQAARTNKLRHHPTVSTKYMATPSRTPPMKLRRYRFTSEYPPVMER